MCSSREADLLEFRVPLLLHERERELFFVRIGRFLAGMLRARFECTSWVRMARGDLIVERH